jgi:L-cysteate sulfo-lyase
MLDSKARIRLCNSPTPLEPLPRLNAELGGPRLFIKRDDCSGLATGGNKARKLEFLLGEALAQGASHVITVGALQSNHVRQTAAAAARVGLPCLALLENKVDNPSAAYQQNGNLLLDRLFGAEIRIYPRGTDMAAQLQEAAAVLRRQGQVPYAVPLGGSSAVGNLGYVACAEELLQQAQQMGITLDHIVLATGSGGTQAGLLAGMLAQQQSTQVIGISIMGDAAAQSALVCQQVQATLETIGASVACDASAVRVESGYVGEGYGMPTANGLNAILRLARLEAILLDPVYTGKAMAGLIDLVGRGCFSPLENVVFLHTGGQAGLFAYSDDFTQNI